MTADTLTTPARLYRDTALFTGDHAPAGAPDRLAAAWAGATVRTRASVLLALAWAARSVPARVLEAFPDTDPARRLHTAAAASSWVEFHGHPDPDDTGRYLYTAAPTGHARTAVRLAADIEATLDAVTVLAALVRRAAPHPNHGWRFLRLDGLVADAPDGRDDWE